MIPYRSPKIVDGLCEYYVGHSHNPSSVVLCTYKTPQTTDKSSGTCMRFYSCFTLPVCLNWSWQPKRVWCKLLLLRTVNCRPTTFHSTTALQSTAKYCNSKATTFISWRFPSQTHTGYQRSWRMEVFSVPQCECWAISKYKPRSDPSLLSTNNGFPITFNAL